MMKNVHPHETGLSIYDLSSASLFSMKAHHFPVPLLDLQTVNEWLKQAEQIQRASTMSTSA